MKREQFIIQIILFICNNDNVEFLVKIQLYYTLLLENICSNLFMCRVKYAQLRFLRVKVEKWLQISLFYLMELLDFHAGIPAAMVAKPITFFFIFPPAAPESEKATNYQRHPGGWKTLPYTGIWHVGRKLIFMEPNIFYFALSHNFT